MSIGARIDERLTALGWSQAELARRVGIKSTSIWKLVTGQSQTTKHLHSIARHLGTTPEYLMGETDDPSPIELGDTRLPFKHQQAQATSDTVELPEFDLAYGMGATFIGEGVIERQPIVFSRAWIRNFTGSPIDKLFFARGIGDSMEPKIFDSDILLIDTAQDTPRMWDQIWALDVGGLGMIKRLRPEKDGGMRLISDNEKVPDYVAYDDEMRVIGRVVGIMRKT